MRISMLIPDLVNGNIKLIKNNKLRILRNNSRNMMKGYAKVGLYTHIVYRNAGKLITIIEHEMKGRGMDY